jgi:hypothetical protein
MVNESMKNYNTSFTYSKVLTMDLYHRLCTKTWLHKINFLSGNINSLPFKVHVTAYHTKAHQIKFDRFHHVSTCCTSTREQMTLRTNFQYFSDCFYPSSELDNSFSRWTLQLAFILRTEKFTITSSFVVKCVRSLMPNILKTLISQIYLIQKWRLRCTSG